MLLRSEPHTGSVVLFRMSDFYIDVVSAEAFKGCAVEFLAVVRMGDADEEFRPFLH